MQDRLNARSLLLAVAVGLASVWINEWLMGENKYRAVTVAEYWPAPTEPHTAQAEPRRLYEQTALQAGAVLPVGKPLPAD